MAEFVPHPLVTRVGIGLTGQTAVTLPPGATGAAGDLGAELTTAADAAKLAAQNAAAQAAWAAAIVVAQAAEERSSRAKAALKQAQMDARGSEAPPEQLDELASAAKQAEDEAKTARKAADDAENAAKAAAAVPAPQQSDAFDPIDTDDVRRDQKEQLAAALADNADLPELSLFAGFLGGQVVRGEDRWRLVYLDSRLYSWLLVQEDDILVHQRLADDHAPSGLRDVLWVRGNANVLQGSGAQSTAGRFLVGEFTRAGDFAASTSGGTFSAATGLLCEATTPGCCMRPRTR